ncbi:SCO4225 family membrane protein [Streptomyces sp. YIM S03343]
MPAFARSLTHRLRQALTDVFALSYLAICAALLIWALVVSMGTTADGAMAMVIPLFATAPTCLVLLTLPGGSEVLIAAVVVGALLNATLIGWCARTLRRGRDSVS